MTAPERTVIEVLRVRSRIGGFPGDADAAGLRGARLGLRHDVSLHTVTPCPVRRPELSASSLGTASRTNSTTPVRVDVTPADPATVGPLHPELAGPARADTDRVPFGPNTSLLDTLARAPRTYPGERDRGVVDGCRVTGPGCT